MSLRALKEKAAALLVKGQLERAEVLFRQVLTQAPRDSQTWLRHAEVLKRLGRTRDAVGSYRLAARVLDDEGHHPRAAAALKLALSLLPNDVDLIADIIRSEMKALRPGEGVRSLFPVSSPSQLLASASATPFASSNSVVASLLALPDPDSRAAQAQARSDTWVPDAEPTPLATAEDQPTAELADASSDAVSSDAVSSDAVSSDAVSSDAVSSDGVSSDGVSSDAVSSDAVSSDGVSSDAASSDAVSSDAVSSDAASSDAVSSDAVSSDAVSSDAVSSDGVSSDAGPVPQSSEDATASEEQSVETDPSSSLDTEEESTDSHPAASAAFIADALELEVSAVDSWPQVRRVSDHQLAIQTTPGARWIVIQSEAPLTVRFVDSADVPEDAMWLEE